MKLMGLLDRLAGEYGVLISDLRLDQLLRQRAIHALRRMEVTKDSEDEMCKALNYLNGKEPIGHERTI